MNMDKLYVIRKSFSSWVEWHQNHVGFEMVRARNGQKNQNGQNNEYDQNVCHLKELGEMSRKTPKSP